jgi:hypothetical protein
VWRECEEEEAVYIYIHRPTPYTACIHVSLCLSVPPSVWSLLSLSVSVSVSLSSSVCGGFYVAMESSHCIRLVFMCCVLLIWCWPCWCWPLEGVKGHRTPVIRSCSPSPRPIRRPHLSRHCPLPLSSATVLPLYYLSPPSVPATTSAAALVAVCRAVFVCAA